MDNDKDKLEKPNDDEIDPQEDSSTIDAEKESGNEENLPGGPENEVTNHWVKEIPEDPEMDEERIVESLDNISVNKGDLPDWINELSPADQGIYESDEDIHVYKENLESIQLDAQDLSTDEEKVLEEDHDEKIRADEPRSSDEGFVEISEYDIEAFEEPEKEPRSLHNAVEEQEELPDWLEDMISEEQQHAAEGEEKSFDEQFFLSDEPTKPVPIIEEIVPETYQEEMIEEIPSVENRILDEINFEETESQMEESIHIVEFDVESEEESQEVNEDFSIQIDQEMTEIPDEEAPAQVIDEIEDYEEIQEPDVDWEIYDQQPVEIPKTLRFAKYLLDQGKIEQADQIFQTYITKADHLEEIKGWVTDAISDDDISQSKLWEILGDIAVKQSEHTEALSAYTRSISTLLKNK